MSIPKNWTELVESIADGDTVLVLGPDAIPLYNGQKTATFSELTRQQITAEVADGIYHYYERDNLFQFESDRAKKSAIRQVSRLAKSKEWLPDSELLRQIVAIPFSVVININPDRFLYDAFSKYWRVPQFDYFSSGYKPNPASITFPDDGYDQPLLYNMAGSVLDAKDSIVLDYHDLFSLLKNLLSDTGVPEEVWQKLQKVEHFVLLGFELERWYFQLFLHYINRLENNAFANQAQNFPILCEVSEDSKHFIVKQFNIEHLSLAREDFDAIYQACEAEGILRKLMDRPDDGGSEVRGLVLQNRFEQAFDLLESELDQETSQVDVGILRSRYNSYLEHQRQGTQSEANLQLELNQLRYAILTFANQITSE